MHKYMTLKEQVYLCAALCILGPSGATIERRDTAWCKQNVRFIAAAHIHLYRSEDSMF